MRQECGDEGDKRAEDSSEVGSHFLRGVYVDYY
jgi:hypothetical protein